MAQGLEAGAMALGLGAMTQFLSRPSAWDPSRGQGLGFQAIAWASGQAWVSAKAQVKSQKIRGHKLGAMAQDIRHQWVHDNIIYVFFKWVGGSAPHINIGSKNRALRTPPLK